MQRLIAVALTGSLAMLTACAGFFVYPGSTGGGSGSGTNFVYVANATTGTVSGYAVGTGALTAVTNSPYKLGFTPATVAINPSNTLLYVAGSSQIYAFSIGSSGALTALNSGNAVTIANAVAMDISPDGQWLFVLDANGISVDEYQISASTGLLTQATGAAFSITNAVVVPHALRVSVNGAFVFVALGTAGDLVFSLNESTGVLTEQQQLVLNSTTTSDNGLAVDPNNNYLYIARSGTSNGLAVYTVASNTGALASVSGSPFAAGSQPYAVAVNPGGTDVYLANRGDNTISGYSVGTNGVLTALSGSPYTAGSSVTALAADTSGKYLLAVAAGGSPDLTMYTFDTTTTGKLDLTTTVSTGTDPTGPVAIAATH